jgi:SAM-dependent methyltransferase
VPADPNQVISAGNVAARGDGDDALVGRLQIADGPVAYAKSGAAEGLMRAELRRLMSTGVTQFCDLGAGANPVVPLSKVNELGLEYVIFDRSREELDKAPTGYNSFVGDISDASAVSALLQRHGPFDVVLSRWTAEHVPDGKLFHEHVFQLLRPGGTAIHLFPTLYSPVFVVNRLMPRRFSAQVLKRVSRNRETGGRQSKFYAYYSWCRGPSRRQLGRLESVGYSVTRYVGFFGHGYYKRVRPLHLAHELQTGILLRHPLPSITSFAMVVLLRT